MRCVKVPCVIFVLELWWSCIIFPWNNLHISCARAFQRLIKGLVITVDITVCCRLFTFKADNLCGRMFGHDWLCLVSSV